MKTATQNLLKQWFLAGLKPGDKTRQHQDAWWRVMCLTGVDYFSTLGYQPSIAFLAAGALSPLATLILVLVTLFGALPVYSFVAKHSFEGLGSVALLERMFSGWKGKVIVLLLLGFAATGFVITITLSAADATAHIVENPLFPASWHGSDRVCLTLFLILSLAAVFLKGFKEAVGLSFVIVAVYLSLTLIIILNSLSYLASHPSLFVDWLNKLTLSYGSTSAMVGMACLLFPKLALGLSGFETGVAVMPLIRGEKTDSTDKPTGRIKNTRLLLLTAASIMSLFLISSSLVTSLIIPAELYQHGGAANGRALAYLAHELLGTAFGTMYDISTILILWFAGASAVAGLLSLIPKYLPQYGMAPAWVAAPRPLVVIITAIAFVVTIVFKADVDAQAGAYATGVLALITSAAIAALKISWDEKSDHRFIFAAISFIFVWTTLVNMSERPEGVRIAVLFVIMILVSSFISRAVRATELRVLSVSFDETAARFVTSTFEKWREVRILAHRSGTQNLEQKECTTRRLHSVSEDNGEFIFLEVEPQDSSTFSENILRVEGVEVDGRKVLRCKAAAVPNAIAAVLFHIRDQIKRPPHIYFGWTEGDPAAYALKYLFFGEGETAPVTREIIRTHEPKDSHRPLVHVA